MWLARQYASSCNDIHPQAHQTGFQIPLDSVRQILGMGGNSLSTVRDLTFDLDAQVSEMSGISHVTDSAGGSQQGLAGNTSAVDTGTADIVSGKHGRLEGLSAGVKGSSVPAHAASDNGDVKVKVGAHLERRRRRRCAWSETGSHGAKGGSASAQESQASAGTKHYHL